MSPLRAFVVVTLASVLSAVYRPARAEERTFGVAVHVAEPEGVPVRDDAWIDAQLAEAERLFGPVGVHFRWVVRTIGRPGKGRVDVETREDRDAFADGLEPRLVNVFVVRSLMDVDEPGRVRRGVTWTQRKDRRRYIVLSSISTPSVLAHALTRNSPRKEILLVEPQSVIKIVYAASDETPKIYTMLTFMS